MKNNFLNNKKQELINKLIDDKCSIIDNLLISILKVDQTEIASFDSYSDISKKLKNLTPELSSDFNEKLYKRIDFENKRMDFQQSLGFSNKLKSIFLGTGSAVALASILFFVFSNQNLDNNISPNFASTNSINQKLVHSASTNMDKNLEVEMIHSNNKVMIIPTENNSIIWIKKNEFE